MAETGGHIGPEDHAACDTDSALGSDAASSTASLASSVLNYEYENGRRYHAFRRGTYILPNDEEEQDRLNLTHHFVTLLLGGELLRSPLSEPKRILDIGTGTGQGLPIWALDIADKFPSAQVLATDLSPIQPEWVAPNLQFQVDDCESEWSFSRKFDFIHIRNLGGSVADWPSLLRNVYENLEPGCCFEVVDWDSFSQSADGSLPGDSEFQKWLEQVNAASVKFGRPMNTASKLKGFVTDAGFLDVQEEVTKVPISPWPKDEKLKEIGRYMQMLIEDSLEAYSLALYTRVLGWSREELTVFLAGVRKDIQNTRHHLYLNLYRVWAKKPKSVTD